MKWESEPMGCFDKRNLEIIDARKSRATYTKIGARFGLSRSRVQQIVSRSERAEKIRIRSEEMKEAIQDSNDFGQEMACWLPP